MTKTVNRMPSEVYVPTDSKLAYQYFGYSSWKGKCTNKNFIGIDQETFEDCNNIYVNENNVLCSRPAIKVLNNKDVQKIYTFGEWTVYTYYVESTNMATITFSNGKDVNYQINRQLLKDFNVVQADEKIFVLGNNTSGSPQIFYYDTVELKLQSGTSLIYKPITTVHSGTSTEELESPNMWASQYRERYIWNRELLTDLSDIVGKTVTVDTGDETYEATSFQKYQEYTVVKPTGLTLTTTNYRTYDLYDMPLIDVSKYNSVVYATKSTKTVGSAQYTYYSMYYSINGITYSSLGELPWDSSKPYNCYYKPQFSTDGTLVFLYTSAGVYAISVLADNTSGAFRYSGWTNLCTTYSLPENIVYSEYGSAYVSEYNTFTVYPDTTKTDIYYVQEGTLSTATLPTVPKANTYCRIFNDADVMVIAYLTTDMFRVVSYLGNVQKDSSITDDGNLNNYTCLDLALYKENNCKILYNASSQWPFYYMTEYAVETDGTLTNTSIKTNRYFGVPLVAESSQSILSSMSYTYDTETISMSEQQPVAVKNNYIYYVQDDKLYSSKFDSRIYFTVTKDDKDGIVPLFTFDCETELSSYYISRGKDLYISATGAYQTNDFEWYFPKKYVEHFDYEITGLHPISTSEIAVFTNNNIYYVSSTTVTRNEVEEIAYLYYKSRIPLGCAKGSEIVTSYDGKYTIFPTKRGLVAMAYQDFVSSTEQALMFLSDNIANEYFEWYSTDVKLSLFKYWLVMYRLDTNNAFVYDMRTASWWPVSYGRNIQQLVTIGKDFILVANNRQHYFDTTNENYKDDTGAINWSIKSQKLHFSAINYYKMVNNITLSSVSDTVPDSNNPFTCNMKITTYRKIMDGTQAPETMAFYIDMIRTFVKHLNYVKLGQFQFELLSDDDNAKQLPLNLTSITIRYKLTGQVR